MSCNSNRTSFGDFLFMLFIISYIPTAIIYGSWQYHRSCSIGGTVKDGGDRVICTLGNGIFWPVLMVGRVTVWATDPETLKGINFPNIKIKIGE